MEKWEGYERKEQDEKNSIENENKNSPGGCTEMSIGVENETGLLTKAGTDS